MKRWTFVILFCGLCSSPALAQSVSVQIGFPSIRFESRPAMVQIEPDYWVVEDYDHEVFFYGGWYWVLQHDRWYRSSDHQGHWVEIERGHVPARFYTQKAGHYRHYRGDGRRDHDHYRPAGWRDQDYVRPAHSQKRPAVHSDQRPADAGKAHDKKAGKRAKHRKKDK